MKARVSLSLSSSMSHGFDRYWWLGPTERKIVSRSDCPERMMRMVRGNSALTNSNSWAPSIAGHAHVSNHQIKGGPRHRFQSFGTAVGELDLPHRAHAAQTVLNTLENHGLIIDKEDSFHDTRAPISSGSRIKKVVPCPSSLSNQSWPWWRLTIAACAWANPCPVP